MKILVDATLPHLQTFFKAPFELTLYHTEKELLAHLPHHDILLCRSTLHVDQKYLHHTKIKYVATASSGSDHIDTQYLSSHNIKLFDAKGCNATAVADYVVTILASLKQRGLSLGKRAGVIGYGAVGKKVVARLLALGFSVVIYDPVKARLDSTFSSCTLADLSSVDLLCIHANLHKEPPFPSYNLINAHFLQQLNSHAIIINAARGEIIDEKALLSHPKNFTFCTDVYAHEPSISSELINLSTLCTPHIAGHSIEAKINAVAIVAQAIHQHFNIVRTTSPTHTKPNAPLMLPNITWEAFALDRYNPMTDTLILKNASNKKEAFLKQRKAHQKRHDFCVYPCPSTEETVLKILGIL